ncbi:hypothetical protein OTERR_08240 [Oryzomicrobium terrae]|uniref:DUF3149 domain-containing protein n=1 Tax=Oryzomicrobium terrae TaxID=1735038 RepID=A0A5C1E5X5_9RHOO|nr:DUF3149 domain-containing protein [Oryzomicrobium terrae]QEL64300.1 hypothetical protein OTERR_08240 [Oryzomicrobium terrae]
MAWQVLLGTDVGLLSLAVIVGVILMSGYFAWYFNKKVNEESRTKGGL